MKVILHYSDHDGNMSSWFDVLRASGHLPFDLTYDELFYDEADDTTEEWLKTEYKPMFEHGFAVGIEVRPETQVQRDLDRIDAGIDDFARKALAVSQDLKNAIIERDFWQQKHTDLEKKLALVDAILKTEPMTPEGDATAFEKISNVIADFGFLLRSCVVFRMETPAQAKELFEQFRHSMSAEYDATAQYARVEGRGTDYAEAFAYDEKSLTISAVSKDASDQA
jgi:hypothetical protein